MMRSDWFISFIFLALIGKVICIESLAYRGRWLDAHHSKWAILTECEEGEVHNKDWAQFVV